MRRRRWPGAALAFAGLLASVPGASAESRFPQPQFSPGYTLPETLVPAPRGVPWEAVDLLVLAVALGLAVHLALRVRSRRSLALLAGFSVLYFGFWRGGCVCPVGATQNVVLGLFDPGCAVPLVVVGFFLLPLVFALFSGRVFCASVCPLGALQDLVVVRPLALPTAVSHALGLVPYLYLGAASLFAATGAGFLICRFDPFVSFFRLSGHPGVLLFGGVLLVAGTVLARPYCRFLCPYGVLLRWTSWFARRHATISPDLCVQCRLCEGACPFGAIRVPGEARSPEARATARRRLAAFLVLTPVLMSAGALLGWRGAPALASAHPVVRVAEELRGAAAGGESDEAVFAEAFRQGSRPLEELTREETAVRRRFAVGTSLLGGFLGLVFGAKLVALCTRRRQRDYEPDRAGCLSCGRCFDSCPVEHARRELPEAEYQALLVQLNAGEMPPGFLPDSPPDSAGTPR